MTNIKILYHKNCPDGFSSAWVAWIFFGEKASYIPVSYQTTPPYDEIENSNVYFVDFVYGKRNLMQKVRQKANKVVVIDHHKSQEEFAKMADDYSFNLDHSGAVLTWKYFYPDKQVPRLLKYIEDIDLWKFNLEYTREIMAVMEMKSFEFSVWDQWCEELESEEKLEEYVQKGRLLIDYKNALIDRVLHKADLISLEGEEGVAINSSMLYSEIGERVQEAHEADFAAVWHVRHGKLKVSLRSAGKVDVSKIADKFGGGGHPNSAAFKLPFDEESGDDSSLLPWDYRPKPPESSQ
ncbi:MAG: DHHA1 domain-containing protein [Candidatus Magasanikbacteria bacterium]